MHFSVHFNSIVKYNEKQPFRRWYRKYLMSLCISDDTRMFIVWIDGRWWCRWTAATCSTTAWWCNWFLWRWWQNAVVGFCRWYNASFWLIKCFNKTSVQNIFFQSPCVVSRCPTLPFHGKNEFYHQIVEFSHLNGLFWILGDWKRRRRKKKQRKQNEKYKSGKWGKWIISTMIESLQVCV